MRSCRYPAKALWTLTIALDLIVTSRATPAVAAAAADDLIVPAVPFAEALLRPGDNRARAEACMTMAIAYEAGNQRIAGQQAVAEVILNRVRASGFPKTVCGVVFAGSTRRTGCQFTFTCDGSLRHVMSVGVLARAHAVAAATLDGSTPSRVPGATNYHADYVSPYWAAALTRVAKLGAHIFYRPRSAMAVPGQAGYVAHAEPKLATLATIDATLAPDAAFPVASQSEAPRPFSPWGLPVTITAAQR